MYFQRFRSDPMQIRETHTSKGNFQPRSLSDIFCSESGVVSDLNTYGSAQERCIFCGHNYGDFFSSYSETFLHKGVENNFSLFLCMVVIEMIIIILTYKGTLKITECFHGQSLLGFK